MLYLGWALNPGERKVRFETQREEGQVKTEAEVVVLKLQAKEHQGLLAAATS